MLWVTADHWRMQTGLGDAADFSNNMLTADMLDDQSGATSCVVGLGTPRSWRAKGNRVLTIQQPPSTITEQPIKESEFVRLAYCFPDGCSRHVEATARADRIQAGDARAERGRASERPRNTETRNNVELLSAAHSIATCGLRWNL